MPEEEFRVGLFGKQKIDKCMVLKYGDIGDRAVIHSNGNVDYYKACDSPDYGLIMFDRTEHHPDKSMKEIYKGLTEFGWLVTPLPPFVFPTGRIWEVLELNTDCGKPPHSDREIWCEQSKEEIRKMERKGKKDRDYEDLVRSVARSCSEEELSKKCER